MAKPEKVIKMGAVRASIFRNVIERDGRSIDIPKIVLEVRYRDKSGQWQGSNSFSTNEVPKAIIDPFSPMARVLICCRSNSKFRSGLVKPKTMPTTLTMPMMAMRFRRSNALNWLPL